MQQLSPNQNATKQRLHAVRPTHTGASATDIRVGQSHWCGPATRPGVGANPRRLIIVSSPVRQAGKPLQTDPLQGECEPCSNNGRVGARGHRALASLDLDLHRNKHASKGCSPNLDTSCDSNISSVARATAKRDREREGRRPRNDHVCPVKTGGPDQHPSTTRTGRPSSKTSPCATGARPDAQPKQTT